MSIRSMTLAAMVLVLATGTALAQTIPPPSGVLNLSTSASVEVTKDVLGVAFSVTRDGTDAQAVQAALKQALDAALAEARKVAKPGQVDVQTGNFALYPRYGAPNKNGSPVITGWQGNAEMLVQGKDVTTIAQLTGRIQTMTIARVGYSLSKDAREKVEADVVAQAVARWRAKAAQMSQLFGYSGYTVREVNVATNEPGPVPMVAMGRVSSMAVQAEAALPTEAGKGEVSANVSGSAQMTR